MRRPVAPTALARLAASLLAFLLALAPASAADRALLNIIGYSEDGETFAFEEFGIQDGSGFAYSSLYVIDLAQDKWVSGTPFGAMGEDEEASLAEVRDAAMNKAADILGDYKITVPVELLTLTGDGVAGDKGTRANWSTPSCCGPGQTQADAFTLILETRGISSSEDYCKEMSPVGFTLSLQDQSGAKTLHEDGDTLPASRGCTLDYSIYAVVQPFDYVSGRRVAIIATYPYGFEGADRRFLAVPIDR